MSNPESEIQQGATVLNISSVCPKCGEVFCREHNVYGLAVKQLSDELERVKKERDELKLMLNGQPYECQTCKEWQADYTELGLFVRRITLKLQQHRSLSDQEKDSLFQEAFSLYCSHKVEEL